MCRIVASCVALVSPDAATVRILFLTPRFPYPPIKGDTLRAYHQISALHEAGHSITLLSIADAPVSEHDRAHIERLCDDVAVVRLPKSRAMLNMALGVFGTRPLQVSHYMSGRFRDLLARRMAEDKFDAVHVALIRMLPYVWDRATSRPPVVADLIDSLALNLEARRKSAHGPVRLAYEMEYRRVRRYEQESVERFLALAVSSPADKEALGGEDKIVVIPNGVDLNRFPFRPAEARDTATLIFTGNMAYGPNEEAVLWFLDKVWPLLRGVRPNLRFLVVGTSPSERVRAMGLRTPAVEVLGKVHDLGAWLAKATVAVAPMRSGSGIQNKVLEAMSAGAPVVTTSIGNRGVGAEHGRQLLVADTARDFAEAIRVLIDNPGRRAELAGVARAYVESQFRWEEHASKLTELYEMRGAEQGVRNLPESVRGGTTAAPRLAVRAPKLNVMQLTDVTGRGGAEKALADIAIHLDRSRYNVAVCATRSAGNYQPMLDAASVRTFVQGRTSRWDVGQWLKLVRLMKRERVDILHTHLFGSNTLGRLLGKLAGVPVIIAHEHWSTISVREALVNRLLHRLSDRVLVPSEASKRLVSKVEGVPLQTIGVLYNGVDTATFRPPTPEERVGARRELGISGDTLLAGLVGRLSPEKGGVDHLIRAIYKPKNEQVRLLIVGDGQLRPDLERLNTELAQGQTDRVQFVGTRQDTPRLLGAMDLFVLPSNNEALPIVLLEAMAVGLPLVATQVGGVPEIVEDDVNGLLVRPGDESRLVLALERLASDASLRHRLGEAGLARVRKAYTTEHMVSRVDEIYRELYARKVGERRRATLVTRHSS